MKQKHGNDAFSQREMMKTWSEGTIQARDWAPSVVTGEATCLPWVGFPPQPPNPWREGKPCTPPPFEKPTAELALSMVGACELGGPGQACFSLL